MNGATNIWSQFRGEWIHIASTLIISGITGFWIIVWFFYRRYLHRSDAEVEENKKTIIEHERRITSHDKQIRDVRAAIEGPRAKLGMDSFHYTE